MAEQYSSYMSSGTKLFFKFQMPTSGATVEKKNGVLELTKLKYHKKWYFPIYFPNSVLGPNISKINANGPFCPQITTKAKLSLAHGASGLVQTLSLFCP